MTGAASRPPRRVVTGVDDRGRSTIAIDGPSAKVIWRTDAPFPDNRGTADAGGACLDLHRSAGATTFYYTDIPPAGAGPAIGLHATDTLDYAVVISGTITLVTERTETVLTAGDVIVDRGVVHAWRNDGAAF